MYQRNLKDGVLSTPVARVMEELQKLENEYIDANGIQLRASQCYYVEDEPFFIMYNTNCPESLKQKIDSIIARWIPSVDNNMN